jgi:hypothetical protein
METLIVSAIDTTDIVLAALVFVFFVTCVVITAKKSKQ